MVECSRLAILPGSTSSMPQARIRLADVLRNPPAPSLSWTTGTHS